MKGLSLTPFPTRLYRRFFETAKTRKRRLAWEHKEWCQWQQYFKTLNKRNCICEKGKET